MVIIAQASLLRLHESVISKTLRDVAIGQTLSQGPKEYTLLDLSVSQQFTSSQISALIGEVSFQSKSIRAHQEAQFGHIPLNDMQKMV